MTSTASNILLQAMFSNELEKFLAGEPPYFFDSNKDSEEPQNVSQAFDSLVAPYWKLTKDSEFPKKFVFSLYKLLEKHPDKNRSIYVAHDWIWHYRCCLNKKFSQPLGFYGDLFEVDLSQVASLLKSLLEDCKDDLINDQDGLVACGIVRTVCGGPY